MSLNREHKEQLNKSLLILARLLAELENVPVDPRALDLFEIAGSLLEQQIDMDIVFEELTDSSGIGTDAIIIFDDDDTDGQVVHIKQDKNIPTAEELEKWFKED